MSVPAESQARRRFLTLAIAGVAAAPIAMSLLPRFAHAEDPHVDPAEPTAKALGYVEDATTAAGNPVYKPGSACAACLFYQGKAGDEYGPCQIFPGKVVHSKGWCSSFNKKA